MFLAQLSPLSATCTVLHILNYRSQVRSFEFVSRKHTHRKRNQILIKQKSLPDDRGMLVFFWRSFLFILFGKVNLEVVVCVVKKTGIKIPRKKFFILDVEKFYVFFIEASDEEQEYTVYSLWLWAWLYGSWINKLHHHIIDTELILLNRGQDINYFFDIKFINESLKNKVTYILFCDFIKRSGANRVVKIRESFLFLLGNQLLVIGYRIGNTFWFEFIDISKRSDTSGSCLLAFPVPVIFYTSADKNLFSSCPYVKNIP